MLNIPVLRIVSIFLISITVIVLSRSYTDYANLLPTFCAILIMIFTLLDYIQNNKSYKIKKKIKIANKNLRPYILIFLSIIYVLLILILGFFISTIIYFIISSFYLGVRNYKSIFATLIILIPLMYVFFVIFLKTNLPKGFLI